MALLDVSEVIGDPDFTSEVTLISVVQSTDADGEPVVSDSASVTVQAVVTSDIKTLSRLPDEFHRAGTILVRVLKSYVPEGFQGSGWDAVLWRGRRFTVVDTADYSQFGNGFLRMTCVPEDANDGSY